MSDQRHRTIIDTGGEPAQVTVQTGLIHELIRVGWWAQLSASAKAVLPVLDRWAPTRVGAASMKVLEAESGLKATAIYTAKRELTTAGIYRQVEQGSGTTTTTYKLAVPPAPKRGGFDPADLERFAGAPPARSTPPQRSTPQRFAAPSSSWPSSGSAPLPLPFPSETNDDSAEQRAAVVALLQRENFRGRDLEEFGRYPLDRVQDAIANADHVQQTEGGFRKSRKAYLIAAIRHGYPLYEAIEKERAIKTKRAGLAAVRLHRLREILSRATPADRELVLAAWGDINAELVGDPNDRRLHRTLENGSESDVWEVIRLRARTAIGAR